MRELRFNVDKQRLKRDPKTSFSGTIAKAIYHLGFYIDSDGDLCQVD